jgi:hypothetical protein
LPSDFGILLVTKNTYSMVDEWFSLSDYSNIPILNIDLNSDYKNKSYGKNLCKEKGINFLDCDGTEMQKNINQAVDFFKEKYDISWVLYMHHDAFPMHKDTLDKLNNLLRKSQALTNFGVIGFNIYHDKFDLDKFDPDIKQLMTTARAPLELGNGYYNRSIESRVDYSKFNFKPYAVESVMWSTAMINYHQFKKHIKIDEKFNFFHSWDDIAFQFLDNNIYNVVIPHITFGHDQSLKIKHKIPFSSPNSNKNIVSKLYGRSDHLSIWKEKWGFTYSLSKQLLGGDSFINSNGNINKLLIIISRLFNIDFSSSLETVARKTFNTYIKKNPYRKKTLIDAFKDHDPKSGPLKYFDIGLDDGI